MGTEVTRSTLFMLTTSAVGGNVPCEVTHVPHLLIIKHMCTHAYISTGRKLSVALQHSLTRSVLHLELLLFNFIGSLRGVNDTEWLQCLHYCLELVDLAAVVKEYAGVCC